jgi:TRAP transporter 4TM/12TM fusion protein
MPFPDKVSSVKSENGAKLMPTGLRDALSVTAQALFVGSVVAWVLNVPRTVGLVLYTEQFLSFALGLCLFLAMLHTRANSKNSKNIDNTTTWYDAIAGVIGLVCCSYVAVRYPALINEAAVRPLSLVLLCVVVIALIIETTRRLAGIALVAVICVLIAYSLLGDLLPGSFVSRPIQATRLIVYLGLDTNAILGMALNISLVVVVPFILMGQVLSRCGGNEFFADLAMATMGRYRGGAAKISVAGSALFGMISNSAVSNVAAVGAITIPMMKRSGIRPSTAGAIEAVGSTGGQLAPPVMGAAAFLMAEFLQVPYSEVVVAASIPALLYYFSLFVRVDLTAAANGIEGEPMDRLPALKQVLRDGWHFPIPFLILVSSMMVWNTAVELAALQATLSMLILNPIFGYRGRRAGLVTLLKAIISAGRASIDILIISAAAGIVIGVLNLTGLAFGMTLQLLAISNDSLLILLILTAILSIILGMGMPTVGVYILLATMIAPALIEAGMTAMSAHMFVMYFGMMSMITPPVALAAFAAASVAKASPTETGWEAIRVGWFAYLVPFMFAYSPALLMDAPIYEIFWAALTTMLGIVAGTVAAMGYLLEKVRVTSRWLFFVAGIALLTPVRAFPHAEVIAVGGLILFTALVGQHYLSSQRKIRQCQVGRTS